MASSCRYHVSTAAVAGTDPHHHHRRQQNHNQPGPSVSFLQATATTTPSAEPPQPTTAHHGSYPAGHPTTNSVFTPSHYLNTTPFVNYDMTQLTAIPAAAAAAQDTITHPACRESRKAKRSSAKSTYKHIPHREKAPHLVARRNARERRRVQAVNTAFVRLRRHVPNENRHKRLSKVKTLHIAIDYINYMQRLIHDYDTAVQRSAGTGPHPGHGPGGVGMERGAVSGNTPVDMVELNSTKENRWMPMNMATVAHGPDQARDIYIPDAFAQFHQG